jgi:hypothetical protein
MNNARDDQRRIAQQYASPQKLGPTVDCLSVQGQALLLGVVATQENESG